ncbi:hypothetical protein [Mucilaginibacter sp. 10B2]|uniref:hypothetical protein n=1 Tax=Mucilaginibacter sp. 10B2 TaxID=3048574 RepID=UPI002B230197|nr:hypothetical protein [Mucilaginibacter sp. 10B2]MEB0278959.1 hypothetical protein [Mucilaginibacter sp. 10B2]
MTKSHFDAQLKTDAFENGISVDGDYIVFDKKSNLNYQLLTSFKLKELLTANPVSKTRLNKNLLLSLDTIRENFGSSINIRASYHSPEYHLITFGAFDSPLYTTGDALALGVPPEHLETLIASVKENFTGEIGIYKWGVHIGRTKEVKEWDKRLDTSKHQFFKDLVSNDTMKNYLLIGGAAAAVWFFFIKK